MSKEQIEEMRIGCPMRHENGNCLVAGGFCTAVNTPICEALHNAYDTGKMHSMEEMKKQGYRKQSVGEWISNRQTDEFICSLCGAIAPVDCLKEAFYESKFCPNCGARMKGGAE